MTTSAATSWLKSELKYGTQISNAELMAMQNVDREAMRQQTAIVQSAMQAAQAPQVPVPINLSGMAQ